MSGNNCIPTILGFFLSEKRDWTGMPKSFKSLKLKWVYFCKIFLKILNSFIRTTLNLYRLVIVITVWILQILGEFWSLRISRKSWRNISITLVYCVSIDNFSIFLSSEPSHVWNKIIQLIHSDSLCYYWKASSHKE